MDHERRYDLEKKFRNELESKYDADGKFKEGFEFALKFRYIIPVVYGKDPISQAIQNSRARGQG